ncbi:hypothetical protein BH20ACT3_BH20ACT3_04990 [soil metagenome]
MSSDKRPVDQAVEYVVYAPLGFVLEAKRLLPTFVERGRQQVQMARMIGQFAVRQGQTEARGRLGQAQGQAEAVLHEFGLLPVDEPAAVEDHPPASGAPPAAPARSSDQATKLTIADYDSLAASQVIPRLAALDGPELEAVRRYESAHRGRKTILGKIAQLQGE